MSNRHNRKGARASETDNTRSRTRSRSHSRSRSRSRSSASSSSSSSSSSEHHTKFKSHPSRWDSQKLESNSCSTSNGTSDRTNVEKGSNSVVCPPPPIISKVSMAFGKKQPAKPVQMKLATAKPTETVKKLTVAKAFNTNDSSDDDVEEMPAECRMRMRNIGRDTPTSSGPNSFGKTKQGFCDSKKMYEKTLRECTYD